jgi:uncharacterized iron-regulated membrane protein
VSGDVIGLITLLLIGLGIAAVFYWVNRRPASTRRAPTEGEQLMKAANTLIAEPGRPPA